MEILPRCHRKNGVCIVVKSDDESYKVDEKNGSSISCNATRTADALRAPGAASGGMLIAKLNRKTSRFGTKTRKYPKTLLQQTQAIVY